MGEIDARWVEGYPVLVGFPRLGQQGVGALGEDPDPLTPGQRRAFVGDIGAGAVAFDDDAGPLQFEVLQYRLNGEYAAETRLESAPWSLARWLRPKSGDPLAPDDRPALSLGMALARDSNGWLVALLPSEWALKTFTDKNDDWIISDQPFPPPAAATK